MEITIQASEFKNRCLQLLNDVQRGDSYLVTKRGVPLAKLSALKNTEPKTLFGAMRNSFVENDDIRKPIDVIWTMDND
ncbi:hypothetical protein FACS189449_01580 [Alphaproteobacteria bacterium]|nr:hypothetical protein FACS189449_01580 [Alphaproteobacteria bacterium]